MPGSGRGIGRFRRQVLGAPVARTLNFAHSSTRSHQSSHRWVREGHGFQPCRKEPLKMRALASEASLASRRRGFMRMPLCTPRSRKRVASALPVLQHRITRGAKRSSGRFARPFARARTPRAAPHPAESPLPASAPEDHLASFRKEATRRIGMRPMLPAR
jgi:hypothetical protein